MTTIEFVAHLGDAAFAETVRRLRNTLATPIGWVVPPRHTFRRRHLELVVALRRLARSIAW